MRLSLRHLNTSIFAALALSFVAFAGAAERVPTRETPTERAPRECERACQALSHEVFEACIDDGGDREACAIEGRRALAECLERCPAPPSCADRCAVGAERVFDVCIDRGGDRADCRARADRYLEDCNHACLIGECQARCRRLFEETYRRCIDRGGDPEECRLHARRELRECIGHCR